MSIEPETVDHVAFGVSDQARSVEWYGRLLGLRRVYEASWGNVPAMLVGSDGTGLALFATREGGAPPGFRHVAFRVSREQYEQAKSMLAQEGVQFEEQDHAVAHSLYFRDPDGIELELTTYL
jgi:catechol 2,3-dioxygenase-like lactoylglutathione lyase family enzyme